VAYAENKLLLQPFPNFLTQTTKTTLPRNEKQTLLSSGDFDRRL